MRRVESLASKETKLVIGLMSGTSCDGIDASLVRISGSGLGTRVKELGFISLPYESSFSNEARVAEALPWFHYRVREGKARRDKAPLGAEKEATPPLSRACPGVLIPFIP